MGLPFSPHAKS